MVKTEPRKATYPKADAIQKSDFARDKYPAAPSPRYRHESGVLAVELAPPNETNNHQDGTNKNETEVYERSRP
jgi:hypothetical protein